MPRHLGDRIEGVLWNLIHNGACYREGKKSVPVISLDEHNFPNAAVVNCAVATDPQTVRVRALDPAPASIRTSVLNLHKWTRHEPRAAGEEAPVSEAEGRSKAIAFLREHRPDLAGNVRLTFSRDMIYHRQLMPHWEFFPLDQTIIRLLRFHRFMTVLVSFPTTSSN